MVYSAIISLAVADVAHLVERHLAKVEVASSSLVIRSIIKTSSLRRGFLFAVKVAENNILIIKRIYVNMILSTKGDYNYDRFRQMGLQR